MLLQSCATGYECWDKATARQSMLKIYENSVILKLKITYQRTNYHLAF